MNKSTITWDVLAEANEPLHHPSTGKVQGFEHVHRTPLAQDTTARLVSVGRLRQLLADSITLGDPYNTHHWPAAGPTSYMLHQLFDKHAAEQSELVDLVAGRIQTLGDVSIAMAADMAQTTLIPRSPKGREDTAAQLARLLHAHKVILLEARDMAKDTAVTAETNDANACNTSLYAITRNDITR